MSNPLYEKISKIRDLINSSRKQNILLQNNILWHMLCSCMDTIGDTEEALESFLKLDTDNSDEGSNYLCICGALQHLIVQQDAVENLYEALKLPYSKDGSLEKIRDIRVGAIGHPTNRRNKKEFNFINRSTLTAHSFELLTYYRTNSGNGELESKRENINVPDLIATQKSVFVDVLNNIIETLQKEEIEHRKEFADKKLIDAYKHTSYPFQKVLEATISPDSPHVELVGVHVDQILKSVEAFKTGLKERDEPDDNFAYRYENLDYAFRHIKAFFHAPEQTHIHREDTYILADFAQRQVEILEEIAEEIDERYSDIDNIRMP